MPQNQSMEKPTNATERIVLLEQRNLERFLLFSPGANEQSTFGAFVAELVRRGFNCRVCMTCWGAGILDRYLERKRGIKWAFPKQRYVPGDWCPNCRGNGQVATKITQEDIDAEVTARPGHETHSSTGGGEEFRLFASGIMLRRLSLMEDGTADDISIGYGRDGLECAMSQRGRAWSLTPYTDAGLALMRRYINDPGSDRDRPVALMSHIAVMDWNKPEADRTALLARAAQEAAKRLRAAEEEWNRVCELVPADKEDGNHAA